VLLYVDPVLPVITHSVKQLVHYRLDELELGIRFVAGRAYTPVFKKRPNFLNSSPTSTEGALRPEHLHKPFVGRTACARDAQFSACSSTTNAHSETGQMAVCCQNLPLGALSSRNAPSLLVGELFKKFRLFF
jgi:hypothetical protein